MKTYFIVAENFPILQRDMDIQFQEARRTQAKFNLKTSPRCGMVKIPKIRDMKGQACRILAYHACLAPYNLSMVAFPCSPRTQEVEAEEQKLKVIGPVG